MHNISISHLLYVALFSPFIVRGLFRFAFPQQIQVAEILAEKKFRKASGTTAEEEAKAPSVEVPDDFEDF